MLIFALSNTLFHKRVAVAYVFTNEIVCITNLSNATIKACFAQDDIEDLRLFNIKVESKSFTVLLLATIHLPDRQAFLECKLVGNEDDDLIARAIADLEHLTTDVELANKMLPESDYTVIRYQYEHVDFNPLLMRITRADDITDALRTARREYDAESQGLLKYLSFVIHQRKNQCRQQNPQRRGRRQPPRSDDLPDILVGEPDLPEEYDPHHEGPWVSEVKE